MGKQNKQIYIQPGQAMPFIWGKNFVQRRLFNYFNRLISADSDAWPESTRIQFTDCLTVPKTFFKKGVHAFFLKKALCVCCIIIIFRPLSKFMIDDVTWVPAAK
jgi:hypothetical protein